ncbi:MAG: DUF4476 domain-containing protein [Ginsengibacter sp.]
MFKNLLKYSFTVLVFFAFIASASAQQDHFIYLQTENFQPFYIKLDNKVISSSSAGYLILPKLTEGDYKLSVGFPKNEFPEENFQVAVKDENDGYLLKNFGEKGWGLFNLLSYNVMMSKAIDKQDTSAHVLQNDAFSKMLANVVKDSSILQKTEPVAVTVSPTMNSSPLVTADTSVQSSQAISTTLTAPSKILSKANTDGLEMVYVDPDQNGNDTVRIFLPSEKAAVTKADANITSTEVQPVAPIVADSSTSPVTPEVSKPNSDASTSPAPVFIDDISSAKKKDSSVQTSQIVTPPENAAKDSAIVIKPANTVASDSVSTTSDMATKTNDTINDTATADKNSASKAKDQMVVLPKVVKSSTVNSDCKAFADNDDFLRLRKKMASESSDDNMIKIAKRAFHSKCFSTEQIKNLSFLFLTDEGKYKFFDEAYAFTSDSDQYNTLQSQLTDTYYSNRFKAMLRK